MSENERALLDIANKLSALLGLSLRGLIGDADFANPGKRKQGVGDVARYLAGFGISAQDIAGIVGAPLQSIRTQLTPSAKQKAR